MVRRGIELRALGLNGVPKKNALTLFRHMQDHVAIDSELYQCLNKFAFLDTSRLDAAGKQHLADIRTAAERWLCEELPEVFAAAAESEREPVMFDVYTKRYLSDIDRYRIIAPDNEHFTRKLVALTERWLAVAEKLTPAQMNWATMPLPWRTLTSISRNPNPRLRWTPGPQELALLDGCLEKMEKHSHAVLKFQGRCGRLWVALADKRRSPEDCYKDYLKAKREVIAAIQKPGYPKLDDVVMSYFCFVIELCDMPMFEFEKMERRLEELYDLWEFMLDREKLMDNVLRAAALAPLDPSEKPTRKLALLDRTLKLIGTRGTLYHSKDFSALTAALVQERNLTLGKEPAAAPKATAPAPWEKIETVVELGDLPGIREIKYPTLAGKEVFVIGAGGEPGKLFASVHHGMESGGSSVQVEYEVRGEDYGQV